MAINTPELLPLTPLACVVVDDNEMSRLMLQHYVDITDGLTLAGAFADGVSYLNYFRAGGVADILLLDINMPELTGLELVRILPAPQPEVVLVTSHRDYAVDAFELQVSDYLVKPLDYVRFIRTVDRIRSKHVALPPPAASTVPTQFHADDNTLFLKINNRLMRVNFDDVLYIEAMSMYSVLVTPKHKHIVYATLKTLEEKLPFAHFMRVHRSYMVNIQCIEAVEDSHLQLPGGHNIPVAKAYQEAFFRRLRGI